MKQDIDGEKMEVGDIVENAGSDEAPSLASGASSKSTKCQGAESSDPGDEEGDHNLPVVIIMVGMAASGKTSLTQRITSELMRRGTPPYIVNLDPACLDPPYPVNIDIRDVVKYKKVMEVYNLGPNGAIVTSLNLFSTKFDEVRTPKTL